MVDIKLLFKSRVGQAILACVAALAVAAFLNAQMETAHPHQSKTHSAQTAKPMTSFIKLVMA